MEHERPAAPETTAEATAPPARRDPSLWPIVAVLAAVVLVLTVALVALRARDDRPRAEVGDVFGQPTSQDPLPHLGQVLLPWARTQVGAGEVREELPEILGSEPTVRAPEGGSFVRVEVDLEEDFQIPLSAVAAPYVQETEVVLRADGRDYPLSGPGGIVLDPNGPYGQGGSIWVAVEGEPTDLEVHVTVDGSTQVVDASDGSVDAGRASDLAGLPTPEELRASEGTPCGPPQRLDDTGLEVTYRPSLECRVQLTMRTPYVDGLGWAEDGREFFVVHVIRPRRVSLSSGSGDETDYWDTRTEIRARLGDSEPLVPLADVNTINAGGLSDPDNPSQAVFDIAAGEPVDDLTLDLVVAARLGEPFVSERRDVRFRWTVEGGELG